MDLWENPLTALYVSCSLYNPKQSCFPVFLNQPKPNAIGFHSRTVPFMTTAPQKNKIQGKEVRFLIKIFSSLSQPPSRNILDRKHGVLLLNFSKPKGNFLTSINLRRCHSSM